jgi:hypothetical protein
MQLDANYLVAKVFLAFWMSDIAITVIVTSAIFEMITSCLFFYHGTAIDVDRISLVARLYSRPQLLMARTVLSDSLLRWHRIYGR